MIKIDFEKAFDNIKREFLLDSLKGFGFGEKWITWMRMCISSAKFSILVNGSLKGSFGATNGLGQGDPLSPLLFIIVAHILNKMLCLGKKNHLIEGIRFPNNESEVLNIQYVDDTLLFVTPSDNCIINLKRILCYFQAYSGLKINFNKSSLTGIGISNQLAT